MSRNILILFVSVFLLGSTAAAGTIYVDAIYPTVGGGEMVGMDVTVNFVNGSETKTWENKGGDKGAAVGTDWSLSLDGPDTIKAASPWILVSSSPVSSFTINALAGDVVFDIYFNFEDGFDTAGSVWGYWDGNGEDEFAHDFTGHSIFGNGIGYTWTFANEIALNGSLGPIGDLYGSLTINFDTPTSFLATSPFIFGLDTDIVVPEPSTLTLFSLGLLGFAGGFLRKRAKGGKVAERQ